VSDVIRKEELASAVEARRELGPEYEDQVLASFMEKVERRLDARLEGRGGRRPVPSGSPAFMVPIALGSMGMGIPLTAIASGTAGAGGIALVWIGIAVVNCAAALSGRRR
jgi:hypothetical protein